MSRGRRYFLMGALALPLAAKIETLAPIVAPPLPEPTWHSSALGVAGYVAFLTYLEQETRIKYSLAMTTAWAAYKESA